MKKITSYSDPRGVSYHQTRLPSTNSRILYHTVPQQLLSIPRFDVRLTLLLKQNKTKKRGPERITFLNYRDRILFILLSSYSVSETDAAIISIASREKKKQIHERTRI